MLIVRAMAEGDEGRFVRNCVVQALWNDVGLRVKKIGVRIKLVYFQNNKYVFKFI